MFVAWPGSVPHWFSNLTILNTQKQRIDKLCLLDVANVFVGCNDNRKIYFGNPKLTFNL